MELVSATGNRLWYPRLSAPFSNLKAEIMALDLPMCVTNGAWFAKLEGKIFMGFCSVVLVASMSLQVVLTQINEFNARNFDLLFAQFYSPRLEVFQHPNFSELRDLILLLNDRDVSAEEKRTTIANVIAGHNKNMFPDLEVLRGHVKKQFASPQELHVDVLEQASFENYVVTFERKKRDGIIVDAADIYYVEDGMILKMWVAKAP